MFKTLIHTSENDNLYIYNHQSKLSILVHPDFRKAYEGSADADPYYIKKYEYLKKHNFFSTVQYRERFLAPCPLFFEPAVRIRPPAVRTAVFYQNLRTKRL